MAFRDNFEGLRDRRSAAYGVVRPVALEYLSRVKNWGAIVFEDKSVSSEGGIREDGRNVLQLFALGTSLRVMGRMIFFLSHVKAKRNLAPLNRD